MIRLFTAIPIPKDIRREVNLMQGGIEKALWTDLDNYHITLSFIGNVDDYVERDVFSILSTITMKSFEINFNGMDTFSKGDKLSHLWTGIDNSDPIRELKKRIDSLLKHHRIQYDDRKFTPHMSLARLRNVDELQVVKFIREHNLYKSRPFKVNEFVLYKSFKGKSGTTYIPQAIFPLV